MDIIDKKHATEQGLTKYFTGKPCKHGHISARYISGHCIECSLEYRSSDEQKDKRKQYNLDNAEYIKQRTHIYYKQNKDQIIQHKNDYYEQFPEKRVESSKKYRNNNKKLIKRWRGQNNGVINAYTAQRYARKLQATPAWVDLEKIKVIYEQSSITTEPTHVDHVIPLQGEIVCGLHVEYNLQIITPQENIKKSNKIDQEFESAKQLHLIKSIHRGISHVIP